MCWIRSSCGTSYKCPAKYRSVFFVTYSDLWCGGGEKWKESVGYKSKGHQIGVGNSVGKETLPESNREPQRQDVWASHTARQFVVTLLRQVRIKRQGKI